MSTSTGHMSNQRRQRRHLGSNSGINHGLRLRLRLSVAPILKAKWLWITALAVLCNLASFHSRNGLKLNLDPAPLGLEQALRGFHASSPHFAQPPEHTRRHSPPRVRMYAGAIGCNDEDEKDAQPRKLLSARHPQHQHQRQPGRVELKIIQQTQRRSLVFGVPSNGNIAERDNVFRGIGRDKGKGYASQDEAPGRDDPKDEDSDFIRQDDRNPSHSHSQDRAPSASPTVYNVSPVLSTFCGSPLFDNDDQHDVDSANASQNITAHTKLTYFLALHWKVVHRNKTEDSNPTMEFALEYAGEVGWLSIGASADGRVQGSTAVIASPDLNGEYQVAQYTLGDSEMDRQRDDVSIDAQWIRDANASTTVLRYTKRLDDPSDLVPFMPNASGASPNLTNIVFAVGNGPDLSSVAYRGTVRLSLEVNKCREMDHVSITPRIAVEEDNISFDSRRSGDRVDLDDVFRADIRDDVRGAPFIGKDNGGDKAPSQGTAIDEARPKNEFKTTRPPWYRHAIIAAHGVIAIIGWAVVSPVGVSVGYFRRQMPAWIYWHVVANILCASLTLLAFIIAVVGVSLDGSQHFHILHNQLGLVLTALMVVQVIGGARRPAAKPRSSSRKRRKRAFYCIPLPHSLREGWLWFHRATGLACVGLGLSLIRTGLQLYSVQFHKKSLVVHFYAWVGTVLCGVVFLKLWTLWGERTSYIDLACSCAMPVAVDDDVAVHTRKTGMDAEEATVSDLP